VVLVRRTAEKGTESADAEVSSVLTEIIRMRPRAFTCICTIHPDRIRPANPIAERLPVPGNPVAVAGVMWPGGFFEALDMLGIPVAERLAFRDHVPYGPRDVARIREFASDGIICTLKDAVKLGPLLADEIPVWYLEEVAAWDSGAEQLRHGVLQIAWVRPPHQQMGSVHGDRN
jgi:tetraacyldisaccharide-1-P 4'-kinase